MAEQIGIADNTKNGLVDKKYAFIVNGFNEWIGEETTAIASIRTSYFCALIAVSKYNAPVFLYAVSVGQDGYGLNVFELTGHDGALGFSVSNGQLYISGAFDRNVRVMILAE